MTQARHYRYSLCGHSAHPAFKDFVHSQLSHVRFCDAPSGQNMSDQATDFEAVDVAPDRLHGLCPKCLLRDICNKERDYTLPAQVFRSSIVSHKYQCQDDGCRMHFVMRKIHPGSKLHEAARTEKPQEDATRIKMSRWSALFNKPGDDASNKVGQNGIVMLSGHQDDEEKGSHDFGRTSLCGGIPEKANTPRRLPAIAAYDNHDTFDNDDEMLDIDAGEFNTEQKR